MEKKENYEQIFNEFKEDNEEIQSIGQLIGIGGFGEVREVIMNGKIYAGKLAEKKKGSYYIEKLKGPYIVKIIKIIDKTVDEKDYNLIIMEKSQLRDLGTMTKFIYQYNFLRLINNPFSNKIGENLLRFFTRQIIKGLETLERNELVHFDIKPENILITTKLQIKISDFSFLMSLKENKDENLFEIPGGTPGYFAPEYFDKKKIDRETAKKQDYFALGATLYYLKVGELMLKYQKYADDIMTKDRIIDLLQRRAVFIKSKSLVDENFKKLIYKLIQYIPEERPSFEEIYRNKWINKDWDYILGVFNGNLDTDENKLMEELLKSDFLIEKNNEIKEKKRIKKKNNFIFEL